MTTTEERIRARAHAIWQREGCPDGRDREHWDMATEEIAIEDNQNLATKPNPLVDRQASGPGGAPVEPLEAVENQGEFPSLADQGEDQLAPQRRPRRR